MSQFACTKVRPVIMALASAHAMGSQLLLHVCWIITVEFIRCVDSARGEISFSK